MIGKDTLDQQIAIAGSVTDAVANLTPSFSPTRQKLSGAGETLRRQARHARTRLIGKVLAHYGLEVSDDWSAMNYVVGNRKGTQQVVGSLAELWPEAARMAGRPLDPLDPALLQRLRAAETGS